MFKIGSILLQGPVAQHLNQTQGKEAGVKYAMEMLTKPQKAVEKAQRRSRDQGMRYEDDSVTVLFRGKGVKGFVGLYPLCSDWRCGGLLLMQSISSTLYLQTVTSAAQSAVLLRSLNFKPTHTNAFSPM